MKPNFKGKKTEIVVFLYDIYLGGYWRKIKIYLAKYLTLKG